MANNYVEASFCIDNLTKKELEWWEKEGLRECPEDMDPEDMEVPISHSWEMEGTSIWFHHDESIDVDASASVIQRFLKESRPNGCCGFCWAETCSKARVDEFGGGGCFITADSIEWNSVHSWVEDKKVEFLNREKGFPRIDLCFQGWCRGAEITEAWDLEASQKVDLTGITSETLADMVSKGLWSIALSDCLGEGKEEIEISDVEASRR